MPIRTIPGAKMPFLGTLPRGGVDFRVGDAWLLAEEIMRRSYCDAHLVLSGTVIVFKMGTQSAFVTLSSDGWEVWYWRDRAPHLSPMPIDSLLETVHRILKENQGGVPC